MKTNALLDKSAGEIKLGGYRVAAATALADPMLLPRVQEYRRLTSARMYPLDRGDIRKKIPKADYLVSRKVDGEFNMLIFDRGEAILLNPGGTVRTGLPVLLEAAQILSKANVERALIPGELYVQVDGRRARVHDVVTVARQPQSEADLKRLHFAVFDMLQPPGAAAPPYAETWKTIERLFAKGERIHPIETKKASGPDEIEACFEKWVEKDGAEGLVARSDTAGMFKIKPRHTIDVVVLGFTESVGEREGMLHDMLFGVMRRDGTFQVLARVGGGFNEDERRTMLADLKDMIVTSEYAEVNSDNVAYNMVQPDWIIEVSCLDFISQTTRGAPVNRMVLDYQSSGEPNYRVVRRMPLATVISPQYIRRREDKSARPQDVRIEQVSQVVEVSMWDRDARQMVMPKSEVLRRDVYTKVLKGETMVRKFLLWQTHKEGDDYPAYVLHFTDFSPGRKTPLAREIRVSSSREQMESLWKEMLDENVKKGWEIHSSTASESKPVDATPAVTAVTSAAPTSAAPASEESPAKPTKRTTKKSKVAEEPGLAAEASPKESEPQESVEAAPPKKKPAKKRGS